MVARGWFTSLFWRQSWHKRLENASEQNLTKPATPPSGVQAF